MLTRKTRLAAAKTIQSGRKIREAGLAFRSLGAAASRSIDWSKPTRLSNPRRCELSLLWFKYFHEEAIGSERARVVLFAFSLPGFLKGHERMEYALVCMT
jgi:hypothetical protein